MVKVPNLPEPQFICKRTDNPNSKIIQIKTRKASTSNNKHLFTTVIQDIVVASQLEVKVFICLSFTKTFKYAGLF